MRLQYGDKIWIKDQNGIDQPWIIEKENDNTYEIYHSFVVSHIPKDRFELVHEEVVHDDLSDMNDRDEEGSRRIIKRYKMVDRIKYQGWLYMPENPGKEVLDIA